MTRRRQKFGLKALNLHWNYQIVWSRIRPNSTRLNEAIMDNFLDLSTKRICVTGGAGFLGSHLQKHLRVHGAKDIFIPKYEDYDFVKGEDVARMYKDAQPDVVIHLAAHVGGIGANREKPAEFFYDNLMMGVQLMHQGWLYGLEKFVAIGTI